MKVTKVSIQRFRHLRNVEFKLGKMLTVISGTNATGKSTLLGMIGNACELIIPSRPRSDLFRHSYRTEFSEILRGALPGDETGSNLFRISFDDNDFRNNRITWQKERFRLIPYRDIPDSNRRSHEKKKHPVIYLGLSRLFPIGEANHSGCTSQGIILSDSEDLWYKEKAQWIMSMLDPIQEISKIKISETDRKQGFGFTTNSYGPLTNSSGQDNLGQILYAILAFRRLKEHLGDIYSGGLLLIDELDATLHPSSQARLIDTLIQASRDYDLQVITTTHSLSLLEYIYHKTGHNNPIMFNNIESVYLTNVNGPVQIMQNANPQMVRHEMMATSSATSPPPKIMVYTEDEEARWLLRGLLAPYAQAIHIVEHVSLGWREYLKLIDGDPLYFNNVIIVLDGDARDEGLVQSYLSRTTSSLILLPGSVRPEQLIRDFLRSLTDTDEYLANPQVRECGYNRSFFLHEQLPTQGQERERYKEWFKSHLPCFNQTGLLNHWMSKNQQPVQQFIEEFKNSYNKIAQRRNIRAI